jgi:hypothetical protein
LGDVGDHRQNPVLAALGTGLSRHLFEFIRFAGSSCNDPRADAGQTQRHRSAQSAPATGDNSHPAFKCVFSHTISLTEASWSAQLINWL